MLCVTLFIFRKFHSVNISVIHRLLDTLSVVLLGIGHLGLCNGSSPFQPRWHPPPSILKLCLMYSRPFLYSCSKDQLVWLSLIISIPSSWLALILSSLRSAILYSSTFLFLSISFSLSFRSSISWLCNTAKLVVSFCELVCKACFITENAMQCCNLKQRDIFAFQPCD